MYSTLLGGSGADSIEGLCLGASNSVFLVGETFSPDLPALNASSISGTSSDAFRSHLNPQGNWLVDSRFLGGSADDAARDAALGASGSLYITGRTASVDFPTVQAVQSDYGGGLSDAFVVAVSSSRSDSAVTFSTLLGGSLSDRADAVAAHPLGGAYVVGQTFSSNSPTLNPLRGTFGGGFRDGFVSHFRPLHLLSFAQFGNGSQRGCLSA